MVLQRCNNLSTSKPLLSVLQPHHATADVLCCITVLALF